MGEEDGVAKSPEWAAPITGVPARIIKALADEWASKRTTVVIGNGGPGIRGPYSTEPARLQVLCLAMQGLGKPGANQSKMIEWALGLDPEYQAAPEPAVLHHTGPAYRGGLPTEHQAAIARSQDASCRKLILEGAGTWYGNKEGMRSPREDQFIKYKYPADGCSKIHMIWTDSPSWITCWNDGNNFIRAMRARGYRVHLLPAPLDRERRPVRRRDPAGEHQTGRRRHRQRHLQRADGPALPAAPLHRVAGRDRSATTRSSARSPSAWGCSRSTPAA